MKTSVKQYKRGSKRIILVGVSHIGCVEYYNELQNILDNYSNEYVLFEGVGGFDELKGNKSYDILASKIGLVAQKNSIKYRDEWIRSDLNKDILLSADSNFVKKNLKTYLKTGNITRFQMNLGKLISPFLNIFSPVVIDLRNYNLILDLFKHLIKKDTVCIFYGEGHIYGIDKYIKRVGFKKLYEHKVKAF